jgi:hypothetical protein
MEERSFRPQLEELAAILLSVEHARPGDVITFDWRPEAGTLVRPNGQVNGGAIPGEELYRALLKVWRDDRPTGAGLERALLGQVD